MTQQPPRYHVHDDTLIVLPYVCKFETFAKTRYLNKTLLAIYETEFYTPVLDAENRRRKRADVNDEEYQASQHSYFHRAIELGLIRVNGEISSPSRLVKMHDRLSNLSHRHEPPVRDVKDWNALIFHQDDDFYALDKPSTIAVHPGGSYRYNTLVYLLSHHLSLPLSELLPCHRLDRLTSGLIVLARNKKAANDFQMAMRAGEIQKTYLARVSGEFPVDEAGIGERWGEASSGAMEEERCAGVEWVDGEIVVRWRLRVKNPRLGVHECVDVANGERKDNAEEEEEEEDGGRNAVSAFSRHSYDSTTNTSLVECRPITGKF